ncbi:hypothetical protein L218DRAFT_951271 [Marasmius fiardii PR-910]|nr:hypothetical protein L218DRAFT_951271 [Marasmius fiardii PR-910]
MIHQIPTGRSSTFTQQALGAKGGVSAVYSEKDDSTYILLVIGNIPTPERRKALYQDRNMGCERRWNGAGAGTEGVLGVVNVHVQGLAGMSGLGEATGSTATGKTRNPAYNGDLDDVGSRCFCTAVHAVGWVLKSPENYQTLWREDLVLSSRKIGGNHP